MLNLTFSNRWRKRLLIAFANFPIEQRDALTAELYGFLERIASGVATRDEKTKYNLHLLKGKMKGVWEFHFRHDICVEYRIKGKEMMVADIGTHSSLRLASLVAMYLRDPLL